MINYIKKFIAGIAVGIANVIPGVSGGTIAVVFEVYSDLINLAAFDIKKIKEHRKNLLCLLAGIACGILLFARVFKILYERFPVQINFFFVGLIAGSIALLFEFVKEKDNLKKSAAAIKFVWFLLGLSIMIAMYFLKDASVNSSDTVTAISIKNIAVLFLAGIAGAAAMIIPGISGSFILLIMGVYYPIIKAINDFNFPILMSVGTGVLVGIFISARLINFLLDKYPKQTYSFILGLVAGSILHIFPRVCQPFNMRLISAICMLAGYMLIKVFEKNKH